MFGRFKSQGVWWVPEDPDTRIPGVLSYTPADGALLELQRRFRGHDNPLDFRDPRVICGRMPNGRDVTLFDIINRGWTQDGPFTAAYLADWMLLGRELSDPDVELFDEMWVSLPHADVWTEQVGFEITNVTRDDYGATSSVTISYERPASRAIQLASGLSLTFDVAADDIPRQPTSKIEFAQQVVANLRLSEGIGLRQFVALFHSIQFLMSFGLGRLVLPSSLEVLESDAQPGEFRRTTPRVGVFYRPVGLAAYSEIPPSERETLFSIGDLSPDAATAIGQWLDIHPRIEEVISAYYRVLRTPDLDAKEQLMHVVTGMESFHRELRGGSADSEEQHAERLQALEEATKETGHWSWLKGKLALSNELSLERRLRRLIKALPQTLREIFSFADSASLAADTRNYLAHLLVIHRERAATGEDLYWLAEKMRVLLEILLMIEIGVSEDRLRRCSIQNRRWFAVREKVRAMKEEEEAQRRAGQDDP